MYSGAPISTEASFVSIRDFVVSNKLTDSATQQLLDLIQIHCPSDNTCPRTLHKLKHHHKKSRTLSEDYHFCSACKQEIPPNNKKCTQKGCDGCVCYFSILQFEEHLKTVFSGKDTSIVQSCIHSNTALSTLSYKIVYCCICCVFGAYNIIHVCSLTEKWESIQYPFARVSTDGCIQDIHDGSCFKKWMQPGEFLSVPEHTGLVMCADGVPLFKASKWSLWPILLSITSLPPEIRMNIENLLLAGVWLGPVKPDLSIILKPIVERIEQLRTRGIPFLSPVGPKTLKAQLVVGVFDLPAKAMALNCTQYNGW